MGNSTKSLIWGSIIVGIVVGYLFYIDASAVNIPISDDYDLVRVKYRLMTGDYSWWETIQILLEPENDHRILLPRSVALLDYALEGFINYRSLIWFVNASLLGILVFWFLSFRRNHLSKWAILPVLLWYCTPFVFDVTMWGINGMQHTTLNLLVFASLYLLVYYPSTIGTAIAILLAFAATFTNGNGFLIFPAGLVILLLSQNWKKSIVWGSGMVLSLLAYFLNYSFGQATQIKVSGDFFQNLILSFGALVGGWAAAFRGQNPSWLLVSSFIIGIITLIGLLTWFLKRTLLAPLKPTSSKPYFWIGVFLFSVMTIGIIAISRGGRDVYSVFTSRYSLYPLHILTIAYGALLLTRPIPNKWLTSIASGFGVLFMIGSYYQYQVDVETRRRSLVADHYNWRHHRKLLTHFRSELADFYTQPAYDKGLYRFNNSPLATAEAALDAPADTNKLSPLQLTLSTHSKPIDYFGHPQTVAQFTLENESILQPNTGKGTFIVLKSSNNTTYVLPAIPQSGGRKLFVRQGKIYKSGFKSTFYNENFVPADYRIGILSASPQGFDLKFSNQIIRIDSLHAKLID